MNLNNPLIAYRAWFIDQDVEWADSIASSYKDATYILATTNLIIEEIGNEEDTIKELEEIIVNDYEEDEDEFNEGRSSTLLIKYLDKFINLNDRIFIKEIAVALFSITNFTLLNYDKDIVFIDIMELNKTRHIKGLLNGNKDEADYYEAEIQQELNNRISRKKIKNSWDKFTKKEFNYDTIQKYLINDILGR